MRPARVFRTLVLTALAALPMKTACSGARRGTEADRPAEAVHAGEDAGTTGGAGESLEEPDGGVEATDAGEPTEPADAGQGTVFRGGPDDEVGTGGNDGGAAPDPDGTGRVWRGGPDEEVNTGDRDGGTRDDGRTLREDAGPPRRDVGGPVPAYAVPMPEYGVPIPDPMPQPMYGVEPHPGPVSDYGVEMPPIDDDDMVLRYGVPFGD